LKQGSKWTMSWKQTTMRTELSYAQFIFSALAAPDDHFHLLPCRPVASLILRSSGFCAMLSDIMLCNVMKWHVMYWAYVMAIFCHAMLCNALYYVFACFCIVMMYVYVYIYIDTMIYVCVGTYVWSSSSQIHLPPPARDHTADLCT
jgi:hypothetical protein